MQNAGGPQRFPIRFSRANRAMGVVGLRPRSCWIDVGATTVVVHMSWAFRLRLARTDIRDAQPDHGPVGGWGVHGWRGRWLVNGSSDGLVRVTIDPPATALVCGFPVKVHTLRVSLDDPGSFIEALLPQPATGADGPAAAGA